MALSLVVKKEPEEEAQTESEDVIRDRMETGPFQSEFVNIKTEMDMELSIVRVKQESHHFNCSVAEQEYKTAIPHQQHPQYGLSQKLDSMRPPDLPGSMWQPKCDLPTEDAWHSAELDQKPNPIPWNVVHPVDISVNTLPIEYTKSGDEKEIEVTSNGKRIKGKQKTVNKDGVPQWTSTFDGKFACKLCAKTYSTHGNFQRHYLVHSLRPIECNQCGKSFTTLPQLQRHTKVHGNYDCDECGKVFKSASNLFQHKRTHMAVKPFKCPLCDKQFSVRANLKKHQGRSRCKIHTGPITCDVCHKVFKTMFLLKSHLRRHTTEKPFSCDMCEMNFKYKSTLIRHIQMHNGVRPYVCKVCDKAFTHVSLLKPHMRKHTGEKPYSCPKCSKMFAHKHNMERHALRHAREKKTVCEVCNKKFPKESRLKYHMRTHANEKHFRCYVCPKQFSHRQNVLRHYSRKHPNSTYDCTDTDAKIATKLWQEALSKKAQMTGKVVVGNENVGNESLGVVMKEDGSDTEEILPDVNRSVKKKKLTRIVDALSKKVAGESNENSPNHRFSIKVEYSDSDDEVLAKKVVVTNDRGQNSNSNEFMIGNESVVVRNQSVAKGDEIIADRNLTIVLKKEIISDDEEILPDKIAIDENFPPVGSIKTEMESVISY